MTSPVASVMSTVPAANPNAAVLAIAERAAAMMTTSPTEAVRSVLAWIVYWL
jgi:choline dehydrogenase-like flavoprotein